MTKVLENKEQAEQRAPRSVTYLYREFKRGALEKVRQNGRTLLVAKAVHKLFLSACDVGRSASVWFSPPTPVPGLAGNDVSLRRVESEVARIAAQAGGRIGIAALHLETGRGISLNGTTRFPMASTVKVPLALQVLALVDQGELQLNSMINLEPRHVHPGCGSIARRFQLPGVALSVSNLLELTLVESDNSATDILFDLAGGPKAVATRLGALGITDISVERPTIRLVAEAAGVTDLPWEAPIYPAWWSATKKAVPREIKKAAWRAFLNDPRDTATPEAMACLLAIIGRGKALSSEQTTLFLDIMARCTTGKKRLKGLLPTGTRVAHKTGSLPEGVNNDVGIIKLPNGGGSLAVAVFVIGLPGEERKQNKVIARIGRTLYDHFASHPAHRMERVTKPLD